MKILLLKLLWDKLMSPEETEPVNAMRERLAKAVMLVTFVISLFSTSLCFAGWIVNIIPLDTVVGFTLLIVFLGIGFMLSRHGLWRIGGVFPVIAFFSTAVTGNIIGGISVPAILLYVICIILVGMIYGGLYQWIGFFVCVLSYLGIAYAHFAGHIHRQRTDDTAFYNRVTIAMAAILCIFLLVRFIVKQYQQALVTVYSDRDEIKKLAAQNETLYLQAQEEIDSRRRAEDLIQRKNEELTAVNEELNATLEQLEVTNEELHKTNEDLMRLSGELGASEEKFRILSEQSLMAIAVIQDGKMAYVNETFCDISGFKQGELLSLGPMEFLNSVHPDDRPMMIAELQQKISGSIDSSRYVYRGYKQDGTVGWYEIYSKKIIYEGRDAVYAVIADRTTEKKNEIALNELLLRYQALADNANEVIIVNQDGVLKYVNKRFTDIIGYLADEAINKSIIEFIHPDDRDIVVSNYMKRSRGEPVPSTYSFRVVTKSGEIKWAEIHAGSIIWEGRPAIMGILNDVTERVIADKRIRDSLHEKEVLLKEIHHRVKNNFQIIVSLLGLQLGKSTSMETIGNLRDAQNRIRAMSLIHEKLYQSKNLAMIDFGEYLKTMATELYRGLCEDPVRTKLEVEAERIELSIDRAIPLGLAVSEIITNSIKYAFPGDREGLVRVAIHGGAGDEVRVVVSDNGIGLPENFDPEKTDTLGFKLVYLLVRDQMHGSISIERSEGTTVSMKFEGLH